MQHASVSKKPHAVSSESVVDTQRGQVSAHAVSVDRGGPSWKFARIPIRSSDASASAEQTPLILGSMSDPLEIAADRAASVPPTAPRVGAARAPTGPPAPVSVREALDSPSSELDGATRRSFENHFGHDFSTVRVHSDGVAARSAATIGAGAYTVADHIVIGEHREANVLAHELAHVVQQHHAPVPWVQRQPVAVARTTPAPRKNFVFIMGRDVQGSNNLFFTIAASYFRAHVPSATVVDDRRNFQDLLSWISTNVKDPIGDLYIVSHGNEDGTLSFGLNAAAKSGRMSVTDLRQALHPSGGGSSALTSVASLIDAQTKVHIKGCDIGRTREIVELIDEAFGGAGTVTAPTHEQRYSVDPVLGGQARQVEHDAKIAAFSAGLPAVPAAPTPVDPKLTGAAKKVAKSAFDVAVAARSTAQSIRQTAIAVEEKRIAPGLDIVEKQAKTIDSLSGPMFQRPGTNLYVEADVLPELSRLYKHLRTVTLGSLAQRLVAPDSDLSNGHKNQQGQRVERIQPYRVPFNEPASLTEGNALYAKNMKEATPPFVADGMTENRTAVAGGVNLDLMFTGTASPPGSAPYAYTTTVTGLFIPDDPTIIAMGQAFCNNPNRYAWRVDRAHAATGVTTLTAVGERVMAYLHHGSLDFDSHTPFNPSENNADFYATSTFASPPPTAPPTTPPTTTATARPPAPGSSATTP